jgi:NAD(P)-dependent dehydrogenase (short-subunit alcohol dehydrogenase family)
VKRFFDDLPGPVDHVMVAAYTSRFYGPMLEQPSEQVGRAVSERVVQVLEIARNAVPRMPPRGTLLLTGGSSRKFDRSIGISPAVFSLLQAFTAALALEIAPVRVNLIEAGFVDTALAASFFSGDDAALEARRTELRARLPVRRVIAAADVAAMAVHVMTNTAVTGATFDVDGGQRLID